MTHEMHTCGYADTNKTRNCRQGEWHQMYWCEDRSLKVNYKSGYFLIRKERDVLEQRTKMASPLNVANTKRGSDLADTRDSGYNE